MDSEDTGRYGEHPTLHMPMRALIWPRMVDGYSNSTGSCSAFSTAWQALFGKHGRDRAGQGPWVRKIIWCCHRLPAKIPAERTFC